jgi:hypothetical protein
VALPTFGPGPLIALVGAGALFELSCVLLELVSRPAAVVWLNWLGCVALMACGLAGVAGSLSAAATGALTRRSPYQMTPDEK